MPAYRGKSQTLLQRLLHPTTLVGIIFLFALGVAIYGVQTGVNWFPHASTGPVQFGNVDPQTHEFYDVTITSTVDYVARTGPGPVGVTSAVFTVTGPRVQGLSTLFGVTQFDEKPYGEDSIVFNGLTNVVNGVTTYVSRPVTLALNYNCIDLFTSTPTNLNSYLMTFCLQNNIFYPVAGIVKGARISSSGGYTAVTPVDILSTHPVLVQVLTTAFDKFVSATGQNHTGGIITRVYYFVVDAQSRIDAQFQNAKYGFSTLVTGLTSDQEQTVCNTPVDNPQKFIEVSTEPRPVNGGVPANGSLVAMDTMQYQCLYTKTIAGPGPLLQGFLSLTMDGGLPLPLPPASPTPSTSAKPTPIPLRSPQITPSFVPPPNTPTPKPTAICKLPPSCVYDSVPCKVTMPSGGWCKVLPKPTPRPTGFFR